MLYTWYYLNWEITDADWSTTLAQLALRSIYYAS